MKKNINIVIFIALACIMVVLLNDCDILNVRSEDAIPAEVAFKNKAGIEQGILGTYDAMQSYSFYGRSFMHLPELSSDNVEHPLEGTKADYAEVDNHVILPENSTIDGIWAAIYNTINTANSVIEKVPGIKDMTDDEKNKALGELYFIRALCHFNLVNLFGAVPLELTPTKGTSGLDIARTPVDSVYIQIIKDLTFAETYLDASTSTKIRASRYAATALLARVYLYHKDYQLAHDKAVDVINNGGYSLPAFSSVFGADGSGESIFEIDFTITDRNRISEYYFPKVINGIYELAPTQDLIKAFDVTKDKRYKVCIADTFSLPYAYKYRDMSTGADNVIVLRLAEMYLIRAETETHLASPVIADIQSDINIIRNRAGLDNTLASTVGTLVTAIEEERRLEFAFEGHRWFDLIRTGRSLQVIPGLTDIRKTLFPIPISEILTNPKMVQNMGY
jgi:starch-binding outer membrane protein, SusD/RagB family